MQDIQKATFANRMDRIQRGKGNTLGTVFVGPQTDRNLSKSVKELPSETRILRGAAMRSGLIWGLIQVGLAGAALIAFISTKGL